MYFWVVSTLCPLKKHTVLYLPYPGVPRSCYVGIGTMIGTGLDPWALSTERPCHFQVLKDHSPCFRESFLGTMDERWGLKGLEAWGRLTFRGAQYFKDLLSTRRWLPQANAVAFRVLVPFRQTMVIEQRENIYFFPGRFSVWIWIEFGDWQYTSESLHIIKLWPFSSCQPKMPNLHSGFLWILFFSHFSGVESSPT